MGFFVGEDDVGVRWELWPEFRHCGESAAKPCRQQAEWVEWVEWPVWVYACACVYDYDYDYDYS